MLNLTRLHLGIAHESQFQGLGIRETLMSRGRAAATRPVRFCGLQGQCLKLQKTVWHSTLVFKRPQRAGYNIDKTNCCKSFTQCGPIKNKFMPPISKKVINYEGVSWFWSPANKRLARPFNIAFL